MGEVSNEGIWIQAQLVNISLGGVSSVGSEFRCPLCDRRIGGDRNRVGGSWGGHDRRCLAQNLRREDLQDGPGAALDATLSARLIWQNPVLREIAPSTDGSTDFCPRCRCPVGHVYVPAGRRVESDVAFIMHNAFCRLQFLQPSLVIGLASVVGEVRGELDTVLMGNSLNPDALVSELSPLVRAGEERCPMCVGRLVGGIGSPDHTEKCAARILLTGTIGRTAGQTLDAVHHHTRSS